MFESSGVVFLSRHLRRALKSTKTSNTKLMGYVTSKFEVSFIQGAIKLLNANNTRENSGGVVSNNFLPESFMSSLALRTLNNRSLRIWSNIV